MPRTRSGSDDSLIDCSVRRTAPLGRWRVACRSAMVAGCLATVLAGCGGAGAAAPTESPRASADSPTARASPAAGAVPDGPTAAASLTPPSAADPAAAAPQPRTSCRSVVHIGDSTSDGLVLPAYQPDAALRIPAQYRRVGVTRFISEVSGARSIVEIWHGFPNAYTVAQRLLRRGYRGCWVLALGTNDTADVAVGSTVNLASRIAQMMSLIGTEPVMWVNVISLLSSGPYSEARMQMWNRALVQACQRYPNMRIYDWAAVAQPSWFIPDGIHYTPQGYAERSKDIANALALAFPEVQPVPVTLPGLDLGAWLYMIHNSCVVN